MKKGHALPLALLSTLVLGACATGENDVSDSVDSETDTSTSAVVEERTVRVAHIYEATHPVEVCGIPAMQDALEGTGFTVESFPGGQLGSENEIIEQVLDGTVDFAFAGAAFLSQYEPNIGVLDAPFVYRDLDQFKEVVRGPIGESLFTGLRDASGLDVFAAWYFGTRHLLANNAVNEPADMDGQKLRVPDAPLYLTLADILGGVATPIAYGELYVSLQQGVADAAELPLPNIEAQKFYEVQDWVNLTSHMIQGTMMTSSDAVTSTMTPEQVSILRDAALVGAIASGDCIEEQERNLLVEWENSGVININSDVDVASFQARAAEIIPSSDFPWVETYLEIQQG